MACDFTLFFLFFVVLVLQTGINVCKGMLLVPINIYTASGLFSGGEVNNIDGNPTAVVTPAMVLQFFTGCDRQPPGGFPFTPCVAFTHEGKTLPSANTCAGRLVLPVCPEMNNPDTTIPWLGSLLLNSLGFGLV